MTKSLRGFRLGAAALVSAVALLCLPTGALAAGQARVRPDIVGGHVASITQFPWQVYLLMSNPGEACGGSILDARHVLTAAHCTDPKGTAVPRTPAEVHVVAGVSNVSSYLQGKGLPAGGQAVAVSSLRVHPYYNPITFSDDVAVLTLAKPLVFNSFVRPIPLASAPPRAGSAVTASGYGQEQPSLPPGSATLVNGSLNWASQTLLSGDDPACQAGAGLNSAVLLCVFAPKSAPCFGDSGGPLVVGNPAVEIGVFSTVGGTNPSCFNAPAHYTNVTAPEIRDFIEGSSAPPIAPRPAKLPQIFGVTTNVDYSPITCNPGTWSGSPSITYGFETTGATLANALQAGPSSTFTPTAAQIGQQISCTVIATNAGGTAVFRTGALDPIVADTVPPQSGVLGHRCAGRSCSAVVWASDPNSFGRVAIQGSLGYTTTSTHCVHVRHRRRKRCTTRHVRHTIPAAVAADPGASGQADGAPTYRVSVHKMPFGSSRLTITAIDAAGNRTTHVVKFSVRRPKKKRPVHHHHPKKKRHASQPHRH